MTEPARGEIAIAIRRKMAAGVLPNEAPQKMWVGLGTGALCEACDQPITDIECEIDLREGRTVRLHPRCHTVWAETSS
jgi:hypothetical protein